MTYENRFDLSLRWADMDVYRHVNNVEFFRLLEEARARLFLRSDDASEILAGGIVVASQRLDYLRPLPYRTDPVTVGLTIAAIGRSSFTLDCRVFDSGEGAEDRVYAAGSVVMVAFDEQAERPRALQPTERSWLERRSQTA
ncbi:acyl-CoA thioesterase [Cryobacterium sp. TMT1-21]|uniref:Acyl-CoA thioesterase n=1 Tax=Cryobacterium shii TaxID=1259235 RepID=A0AAQ2C572_9MICO|nr:acyl-CoA thioesterase [Cryobacterium shii]TFC88145.1 acyl-CoA thioesterase [Cryobacterium sp. TmT2-59]TFD11715.1 acyl-CoA thioesterase [Cryobacterium sp. TMT4-10]TFD14585.1 acyl-CoA thioesterase [Cryobacterium sp. TMT1-21]TFD41669.1 acyl-CoA thioesterase [Cryobacterium sp. TMT2-10]